MECKNEANYSCFDGTNCNTNIECGTQYGMECRRSNQPQWIALRNIANVFRALDWLGNQKSELCVLLPSITLLLFHLLSLWTKNRPYQKHCKYLGISLIFWNHTNVHSCIPCSQRVLLPQLSILDFRMFLMETQGNSLVVCSCCVLCNVLLSQAKTVHFPLQGMEPE